MLIQAFLHFIDIDLIEHILNVSINEIQNKHSIQPLDTSRTNKGIHLFSYYTFEEKKSSNSKHKIAFLFDSHK